MDSAYADAVLPHRVSPFGYLRIEAYLQLPEAFRSLSRPSSAPDAKAFPLRPSLLDLIVVHAPYRSPLSLLFRARSPPHSLRRTPLRSMPGRFAPWAMSRVWFAVSLFPSHSQRYSNKRVVHSMVLFRFELCRLICFTNKIVITHLRQFPAFKCFLTVAFS